MAYIVGIDNGSQSSKVTIFDEDGYVISQGRAPLRPYSAPFPGAAEHPDDDIWTSITAACRQAMETFPGDPEEIAGIGLCTIRFCRALLTAEGELAHPVLSWMDPRVGRPHTSFKDDGPPQGHQAAARSGSAVDDSARPANPAWITTSSGYITHRLTGEFRDAAANYQGLWPINTETWAWSRDSADYERTGMRRDQLFDLVSPGEVLGHLTERAADETGLPPGLPVVATANDKAVEALGCGLRSSGDLLVSLGTYITAMTTGTTPIPTAGISSRQVDQSSGDNPKFWVNFGSEPGLYLYESGGIRRGMWTVSWYRNLIGEADLHTLNQEASAVPAGSEGLLTVLDWLAPQEADYRRGSILGFDSRHGRGHIYRSILEGIAMTMHHRSEQMRSALDGTSRPRPASPSIPGESSFQRLIVSGGGSESPVMMQIMADVFGMPAVRIGSASMESSGGIGSAAAAGHQGGSSMAETSRTEKSEAETSGAQASGAARGAAICAAVGLGIYPSFEDAVQAMVPSGQSWSPDPGQHAFYHELEAIYTSIRSHTDKIYQRTSALLS